MGSIEQFIQDISKPLFSGMHNPWSQACETEVTPKGWGDRVERLRLHLSCVDPKFLVLGEALGYQGCRYSGLAFTSERLLLENQIPLMPDLKGQRITSRNRPWSEPSATTVWGALYENKIAELS
jgi:uracil-DNA glycosylase